MNYRYMRIIVFFDLPTLTSEERKEYTQFRKNLLKMGFMMLQESVYAKLVPNSTSAELILNNIHKIKPKSGNVQALRVTEKQFSNIEVIVGTRKTDVLESDEKLVIL